MKEIINSNEYQEIYNSVKDKCLRSGAKNFTKCATLLAGLPGAGKSSICEKIFIKEAIILEPDYFLEGKGNVIIRRKGSLELIKEIASQGLSFVLPSILHTDMIFDTLKMLKSYDYSLCLKILASEANLAWESMINRAKVLLAERKASKLIMADEYIRKLNAFLNNIDSLIDSDYFDTISVIDRDNRELASMLSPSEIKDLIHNLINANKLTENLDNMRTITNQVLIDSVFEECEK